MCELEIFKQQCNARLESGSYEEVAQLCSERLLLHPDDIEAALFLAEAMFRRGDCEEALDNLEKLNARLIFLLKTFALLGEIYSCKGLHGLAKEFYVKFLAGGPDADLAAEVRFKMESEINVDVKPGPIPGNTKIIEELEKWQDNLARLKKS